MMSMLFRAVAGNQIPDRVDEGIVVDHARRVSQYLTDGVNLYRFLGEIAGGMDPIIGLENCHSLEVMLLPIGELRVGRLRTVIPAGFQR